MKALAINGSPRIDGNTSLALNEMKKVFTDLAVEKQTKMAKENRPCVLWQETWRS